MTPESFDRSLKAFTKRTPFRPFVVELVSGYKIRVDHPESLVFRSGTAWHIATDGTPTLFDHKGVSRLVDETLQEAG